MRVKIRESYGTRARKLSSSLQGGAKEGKESKTT